MAQEVLTVISHGPNNMCIKEARQITKSSLCVPSVLMPSKQLPVIVNTQNVKVTHIWTDALEIIHPQNYFMEYFKRSVDSIEQITYSWFFKCSFN